MTITEHIGQEWHKCPFIWGLEDYVIMDTNAGKLILMNVDKDVDTLELLFTPVLYDELKVYAGDKADG